MGWLLTSEWKSVSPLSVVSGKLAVLNVLFFRGVKSTDPLFPYSIKLIHKENIQFYHHITLCRKEHRIHHLLFHLKRQQTSKFFHQLIGYSVRNKSSGQNPPCFHTLGNNLHSGEGTYLPLKNRGQKYKPRNSLELMDAVCHLFLLLAHVYKQSAWI